MLDLAIDLLLEHEVALVIIVTQLPYDELGNLENLAPIFVLQAFELVEIYSEAHGRVTGVSEKDLRDVKQV